MSSAKALDEKVTVSCGMKLGIRAALVNWISGVGSEIRSVLGSDVTVAVVLLVAVAVGRGVDVFVTVGSLVDNGGGVLVGCVVGDKLICSIWLEKYKFCL